MFKTSSCGYKDDNQTGPDNDKYEHRVLLMIFKRESTRFYGVQLGILYTSGIYNQ